MPAKRIKIKVQFHIAKRNYKRLIKRLLRQNAQNPARDAYSSATSLDPSLESALQTSAPSATAPLSSALNPHPNQSALQNIAQNTPQSTTQNPFTQSTFTQNAFLRDAPQSITQNALQNTPPNASTLPHIPQNIPAQNTHLSYTKHLSRLFGRWVSRQIYILKLLWRLALSQNPQNLKNPKNQRAHQILDQNPLLPKSAQKSASKASPKSAPKTSQKSAQKSALDDASFTSASISALQLEQRAQLKAILLEKFMSALFLLCAILCVISVLAICLFLFGNAIPTIANIGVVDFIFGMTWKPSNEVFGIFPMIVGSIMVSALAICFGVGVGVFSAVYLAYFCSAKVRAALTPCVELLAGIPSIVYGFFGLVVLVPLVGDVFETSGKGLLTAGILLGLMILPTIILISKTSIEAVSKSYYEGALALGASKERAVFFVLLKDAKSGILASIILGMGRAIGEAMAVIVVAGNQAMIPESITDGFRTLTTNIVLELGYAQDLHREVLIACGAVLFVFILLLNLSFSALSKRA
ncbi:MULTISPECIES: phosphate ABC transporter permease subunit PstC [unclassified Helicobacter]|uniref:phosphate ABC transporter permease subunit PstC n=1 Tax=unclassified Helicobacter TaxID=2593540 RepID=UPI000A5C4807|nr:MULTISPECIES: phosphate ABC transporter permease subunit PstC [unclassified Helicobacter]